MCHIYLFAMVTAQAVSSQQILENKFVEIERLYMDGKYAEAIADDGTFISSLKRHAPVPSVLTIKAKVLLLKSYYSVLSFREVNKLLPEVLSEIDTLHNEQDRALCNLYLTEYYNETGSFLLAAQSHAKCSVLASKTEALLAHAYQLEQIKFLTEQEHFAKAQNAFDQLDTLFAHTKITPGFTDSLLHLRSQLQQFKAKATVLRLSLLLHSGRYMQAEQMVLPIAILRGQPLEHSSFLEYKAALYQQKKDYNKALKMLRDAYFVLNTSEYQKQKIRLCLKITNLSSFLEDHNTYDQYIRHLQMYADRNINRYNGYQLAHAFAQVYTYYAKGEYDLAEKRLKKLTDRYAQIPENHGFKYDFLTLVQNINAENDSQDVTGTILDTLAKLSLKYVGDGPAYLRCRLAQVIHQTHSPQQLASTIDWVRAQQKKYILDQNDTCSSVHLKYLQTLSDLYFSADRFAEAKLISAQAVAMSAKLYGSESWEHLAIEWSFIKSCVFASDYVDAIDHYVHFKSVEKQMVLGKNQYHYLDYCEKAAELAELFGDIEQQKRYISKAVKLFSSQAHHSAIENQNIKEKTAQSYIEYNNINMAEKLLLQVLEEKKAKLGIHHTALLSTYIHLADLYIVVGNYAKVENSLTQYSTIAHQSFGENSFVASEGLTLWSKLYSAIGDYDKAKEMIVNAQGIQEKLLGLKQHRLSATYIDLSHLNLILHASDYANIENLLTKAGHIMEASIGKENHLYANYLQVLADLYISNKKYDQASDILIEAEKFWVSRYGTKSVHLADLTMIKGKIAYQKSLYNEAETHYTQAKNIYGSIFSTRHPSYTLALAKLAKVAYMLHNQTLSLTLMEECMPKYLDYVNKYFPSLSFQEKSKFWASMKDEFEFYNFLILSAAGKPTSGLLGNVYNNVISTKALLLSSDIKLRKQIMASNDTTLIRIFNEWLIQKELYNSLLSMTKEQIQEQGFNFNKEEARLEQLEKEMGERSELFKKNNETHSPTWKEVQAQLHDKQYAVEIVRYRFFDKEFKDSVIYAALVLSKQSTDGPELVVYENAKNMENRNYRYYVNAVMNNYPDKYSYNTYWKALKAKIPDSALVYISSEGIFNQINLEMLKYPDVDQYVIDNNEIVYLTNTKDIIPYVKSRSHTKNSKIAVANQKFVVCGNPKFYSDATTAKVQNISTLTGAEREAVDIGELIAKHNKQSNVLLSHDVTEDTVLALKKPLVLHIATHGFFKEVNQDDPANKEANPLFNSGILLAGAGDLLAHTSASTSTKGILTAYEAMDMDLDHTEMVVLSACETGKGKVQVGEGVMGLQRSFLVAGANCVVISLFKVNDEVTHDLMLTFYENWINSKDKRTAFNEAKRTIKQKYNAPLAWGAFIMIEGRSEQ